MSPPSNRAGRARGIVVGCARGFSPKGLPAGIASHFEGELALGPRHREETDAKFMEVCGTDNRAVRPGASCADSGWGSGPGARTARTARIAQPQLVYTRVEFRIRLDSPIVITTLGLLGVRLPKPCGCHHYLFQLSRGRICEVRPILISYPLLMSMRPLVICALVAASIGVAVVSEAATFRVARDGSGDFSVIAEAVDAAASGDTISIAAGDYPETPPYQAQGGILNVVAWVTQSELTVIGDDRDAVIVGAPTEAPDRERGPSGFVCPPGGNISLRGVTVRNSSHGIDANEAWATATDCKFVDCW